MPPSSGGGMQEPNPEAMGGQTGEGGGPSIACHAESWHGPDSPRVTARCQVPWGAWDTIRCTCDTDLCPLDAEGVPDASCAIERAFGTATICQDVLWETCGVRSYKEGYCDMAGLRPEDRATCWTQPDGSHRCQCPHSEQLVPSAETRCEYALYSACATDCQDASGRCEYVPPAGGRVDGLSQYRCSCELGVAGTSPAYFCEDALRRHCRPECEDARGACWRVPDSTGLVTGADCLCAGSSDFVHLEQSDWDPDGEGCRAPLEQTCAGSGR